MALRLGSRGSALALAQADLVRRLLEEASGEPVEVVTVRTSGDERPGGGAAVELEDKSRFVKEIEEALSREDIDLAVHSAKDVPGELPDGLAIVGVPERADARDALCGFAAISELPPGARVGTASLRRRAQLLALRPDLEVHDVRGNVDTRLRRLAEGALRRARAGGGRARPAGTRGGLGGARAGDDPGPGAGVPAARGPQRRRRHAPGWRPA